MGTWIVTGASRGLGRHLVEQMTAKGHRVVAVARDAARLENLAAAHPGVTPVAMDLNDTASVTKSLRAAAAAAGPIDGLINNAGFGFYKPFLEHSEAEIISITHVNLTALMLATYAVLPEMLERKQGHIVNIGSDLGRRPLANMSAYVAAKHGVTGFSHSLLREVKDRGIKVTLINPGIIDTDFNGRTEGEADEWWSLRPAQLAEVVLYAIERPGTMVLDEVAVHPIGQEF